jgi:hypothetical protein
MKIERLIFVAAAMALLSVPASAEEAMTGAQMKELLAGGKAIKLGGPGTGYSGELVFTPDGKGKGEAKTDDGSKTFVIEGTWEIKDDTLCRTWTELDEGKEVCETWILLEPKKVKVMNGEKELGVNYWE